MRAGRRGGGAGRGVRGRGRRGWRGGPSARGTRGHRTAAPGSLPAGLWVRPPGPSADAPALPASAPVPGGAAAARPHLHRGYRDVANRSAAERPRKFSKSRGRARSARAPCSAPTAWRAPAVSSRGPPGPSAASPPAGLPASVRLGSDRASSRGSDCAEVRAGEARLLPQATGPHSLKSQRGLFHDPPQPPTAPRPRASRARSPQTHAPLGGEGGAGAEHAPWNCCVPGAQL